MLLLALVCLFCCPCLCDIAQELSDEKQFLLQKLEEISKKLALLAPKAPEVDVGANNSSVASVKVYHFISKDWGYSHTGAEECGTLKCEWMHNEHLKNLKDQLHIDHANNPSLISASVYNLHFLWAKRRESRPAICELNTTLTLAESEESRTRFPQLFDNSVKHFDGQSTCAPSSDIQRVYAEAYLNESEFLPLKNFSSLIKGASFIASDCHRWDSANSKRDSIVHQIRLNDFRIDGLGRCMRSNPGPEGVSLGSSSDGHTQLVLKRQATNNFMFDMSFENTIEKGYVTEKPFDALIAGTVPVYLGDASHLRSLLPHPNAAIFVQDYGDNMTALAGYLTHLTQNETAYEEHRAWRKTFSPASHIKYKPLLASSWYCRVCEWAAKSAHLPHKRTRVCREGKEE